MQKKAILLALREESSAVSIRDMLERHGYRVSMHLSTQGGVPEALFDGNIDLVLIEKDESSSGLQLPAARARSIFHAPVVYVISRNRIPSEATDPTDIPDSYLFLPSGEFEVKCAIETAVRSHHSETEQHMSASTMLAMSDSLPQGIAGVEQDGAITWCNQSFSSILGYTREEILRKNIADFHLGGDPRTRPAKGHAAAHRDEAPVHPQSARFTRRDGSFADIQVDVKPVRDPDGTGTGYLVILTDITDRRRMEEALLEQEKLFGFIMNQVPAILWLTDTSLRYTGIFGSGKTPIGLAPNAIKGKFMSEILKGYPDSLQVIMMHNRALAGESASYEITFGKRCFTAYAEPLKDLGGAIIGTIGMAYDITDRKNTEMALKASEERLSLAFEASTEGLWDRNLKTGEIYCSPMCYSMLGYRPDEIPGSFGDWGGHIHPDERDYVLDLLKNFNVARQESEEVEFRLRKKNGDWMWVRIKGRIMERAADGTPLRSIGTFTDITEKKAAVEALKKSLEEKEVLLKEVHHRVKNNLQIISSIFSLQASRIPDTQERTLFMDCQNRVRAIALVHEKLYQTQDFSHIDFARYINGLVSHLLNTYDCGGTAIRTEIDIADAAMSLKAAIPCALIVNELISNALKYAFSGRETGLIRVRLKSDKKGLNVLTVTDDGTGIPGDINLENAPTMGLQLVHILALQIHASVDIERNGGTTFNLRFRDR